MVAIVIAVLACIPTVPTVIGGATHWHTIRHGAAGGVIVTECDPHMFGLTDSCRGTFGYADPDGFPGGEPSILTSNVTIVNDPRFHRAREVIDVSFRPSTHTAVLISGVEQIRIIAGVLGTILLFLLAIVAVVRLVRTRRIAAPYGIAALVLSLAIWTVTWTLVAEPVSQAPICTQCPTAAVSSSPPAR
jgi:hypothetical protein